MATGIGGIMKVFGAEYWQKSAAGAYRHARFYVGIHPHTERARKCQKEAAEFSAIARKEYAKEAETTDWKALADKKARDKDPQLTESERYLVVIGNDSEAKEAYSRRLRCGLFDTKAAIKGFKETEEYKGRSSKPVIRLT